MKYIANCTYGCWEKSTLVFLNNFKALSILWFLTCFSLFNGIDLKAEGTSLPPDCGPDEIGLFASDGNAPSTLYMLDPLTGSGTGVGPIGFDNVGALEYDSNTGIYYATGREQGSGTKVLLSIDLSTGIGTKVADLTPSFNSGTGGFDLSYRASDGTMFIDGNLLPDCVVIGTVDLSTGDITVLGPSGTCSPGNAITFVNDNLYHIDGFSGGTLYSTNSNTGVSTPLFPITYTGFPPLANPRVNAMDADENDIVYVSVNDGVIGLGPNYLGILDITSGEIMHLGLSPNGTDGIAWGNSTPCASDCNIQCKGQINVSLDNSCEAIITPAMGAINLFSICNPVYSIEVFDELGDLVPGNLVDLSHRNQLMEFKVTEPCCNNSCWGNLLVEYKLPPKIACPPNDTLSCGVLNLLGIPPAVGACAGFEVFLFSETREQLLCDTMFTNIVTRTYKAVDDFGNEDVCSHKIYLKRLILNDIYFPFPLTVGNGMAIKCSDENFDFDENGFPLPWPLDPQTGSGSGVPIICDINVIDGLICPPTGSGSPTMTGSGSGVPLIPGPFTGSSTRIPTVVGCSAAVTYTDIELPEIACVRKIMRTWEVREWWCNGESTTGGLQLIEIIDDEAPIFECPDDFTVTTNDDCAAAILLPSVNPIDECGHDVEVAIDYPLGYLKENGGEVELEVGENIITYIANDECDNMSSCDMTVTVRDDTEPVAICDQDVDVNLSFGGIAEVFVGTFDEGSWDECGLDKVEIRRMDTICIAADTLFGESISFCCEDVGQDLMIVLQATDKGGNTNQCMIRVHVNDKIPPSMTCPVDMTIDCRDGYDLDNLGVTFGDPVVNDNCAETQVVMEITADDVNQCGIGEITRQFELRDPTGLVYQTCFQHIFINNLTPFVEANIQWPLNYQAQDACGLNDLLPQALPENFNVPVFTAGDDECSLLGYDYQDEIFEGSPGGAECVLIERTWTVINWCSNINGTIEKWTIPFPQIIELTNTIPPEFEEIKDILFESGNVDCESGDVSIKVEATDDCNNPLLYSYIMKDGMDNIIAVGDTNAIDSVFVVGMYTIEWSVMDGCGNSDFEIQNIEVRNTKTPSPVCYNGISVYVQPEDTDNDMIEDTELVEVPASLLDGGSFHTCNNAITISMSSDTTIKSVIYDCDSLGLRTYRLWVTDITTGAQDFCEATIMVIDSNSVDICPAMMNTVNVEGDIYTETFDEIEGVMVSLGVVDLEEITDNSGIYAFNNMPMGGSYVVEPEKDIEHLNGISTLDLIYIQRHVLGLEKLNSPYKLIAADVNSSEDISAVDMIELRKLILGVYAELPNNKSWRFIDAEYQFLDALDPWINEFPEDYEINNLSENMDIDFVGVKIGDVNGSVIANTNMTGHPTENRSSEQLDFVIDHMILERGEIVSIPVYASSYQNIHGWQTTIEFEARDIEVIDVIAGELDLNLEENVNIDKQDEGWLSMSYHNSSSETVEEGEILFEIRLRIKNNLNSDDLFRISSKITRSEAYNESGNIKSIGSNTISADAVSIHSVHPNPWIESTEIEFSTDTEGPIEWTFYDVTGKLLYKESGYSNGGSQIKNIERDIIGTNGVVYVRLISNESTADYKMVLLD